MIKRVPLDSVTPFEGNILNGTFSFSEQQSKNGELFITNRSLCIRCCKDFKGGSRVLKIQIPILQIQRITPLPNAITVVYQSKDIEARV